MIKLMLHLAEGFGVAVALSQDAAKAAVKRWERGVRQKPRALRAT